MNTNEMQSMVPPIGELKFEASDVEVCRICLATDVKMYNLQDTDLRTCMESIGGFNDTCVGLPNYVCYECAPILLKCNKLREKSKTAQAALQHIFLNNGQVTKSLIKDQNRSQLDLDSSLGNYLLLNYDYIHYDEEENTTAESIKTEPVEKVDIKTENDPPDENPDVKNVELIAKIEKAEFDADYDGVNEIKMEVPDDNSNNMDFISLAPYKIDDMIQLNVHAKGISQKFQPKMTAKQRLKAAKRKLEEKSDSTACPKALLKAGNDSNIALMMELKDLGQCFNIIKLSIEKQMTEWKVQTIQENHKINKVFKCNDCQKLFPDDVLLEAHSLHHNPSIHGDVLCGVCLMYFSTIEAKECHSEREHANLFCCKFCPTMIFNNIDSAQAHTNSICIGAKEFRSGIRPRPTELIPFASPPPIEELRNWHQGNW